MSGCLHGFPDIIHGFSGMLPFSGCRQSARLQPGHPSFVSAAHHCIKKNTSPGGVECFSLWTCEDYFCVVILEDDFFLRFCDDRLSRWWQLKYFLFSSLLGDDSHFHSYFSNGLVQPPTSYAIPFQLRRSGMNSWHNVCERPVMVGRWEWRCQEMWTRWTRRQSGESKKKSND